ncbi:hypothetical protein O9853_22335 [Vibrio lentus]|nr:hypothetical protein [Vibrio lentus]
MMLNKTTPLFAFAILATVTTFNVNAAANYEPFVGIDVGTRLSGQMDSESTFYGTKGKKPTYLHQWYLASKAV